MTWLSAALVVAAIGAVFVVAAGRGGSFAEPERDRRRLDAVAGGPITARGLREVKFTLALRGYRADEVDALLRKVAAQLEADAARRREADAAQERPVRPRADEVGEADETW